MISKMLLAYLLGGVGFQVKSRKSIYIYIYIYMYTCIFTMAPYSTRISTF